MPLTWLYLCCVHFRLNFSNDKFLSVLKLQWLQIPFSLCSADFLQLSVNRRTHAVTRTKDNPISSSPFDLTRYHFEYLEGSNRHTSLTLAVSSPSSIIWQLVASFVPVSFVPLSSRFSVDVGLSNLHSGQSCLHFFRNSGPFHHKSALANSSTVRPLVPRSAGFKSVGT